MGYHTMWHAQETIQGVELMQLICKGQVPFFSKKEPQAMRNFIHRLFDITGAIFPTYSNRMMPF